MDKCIYCQSINLDKGLKIRGSKDIGHIHFEYTEDKTGFFSSRIKSEEIFADLCKDCGSITRFYVNDTKRNWYKV